MSSFTIEAVENTLLHLPLSITYKIASLQVIGDTDSLIFTSYTHYSSDIVNTSGTEHRQRTMKAYSHQQTLCLDTRILLLLSAICEKIFTSSVQKRISFGMFVIIARIANISLSAD